MEQYISVYTRQQAIQDGFLVAINSLSPKLVWTGKRDIISILSVSLLRLRVVVDKAVKNEKWLNDLEGVIHDILWMKPSI